MEHAEPVVTLDTNIVIDTDESVDDGLGDSDGDWFCVRTDPFPCPGEGCSFVADYMTAAHLIVVWPRLDDPALLGAANNARAVGRNPRVIQYREDFGKAIPWDQWAQSGQRVHGRMDRPDGWEKKPWKI